MHAVPALLVLALFAVGCTSDPSPAASAGAPGRTDGSSLGGLVAQDTAPGTVTTVAAPTTPAAPGTLIAARPIEGPEHTHAWQIVYHSRGADDRDIAVTGLLIAPAAPEGDVPIVTW